MEGESRRQFAFEELLFLFRTLESADVPCVLMGGQAANFWALRYAATEPALREIEAVFPFVSKDVDFQGSRAAAIGFARALGSKAEVPDFRHAFGNLMAGKFSIGHEGSALSVEVLRKVPGLTSAELLRLTTVEVVGEHSVRTLNPLGVMLAKTWNVVNITKEGRHDAEQLLTMVPCVRAYIRQFLSPEQANPHAIRAGLNLIKALLAFAELPQAAKAAARCGIDWSQALPHRLIGESTAPELVRFRKLRLPTWLARVAGYARAQPVEGTLSRLLGILARHAEPPCVRYALPAHNLSPR